jgi:hypothetical protein
MIKQNWFKNEKIEKGEEFIKKKKMWYIVEELKMMN